MMVGVKMRKFAEIRAIQLILDNYCKEGCTKKQVQEILDNEKLSFDVSTILREYEITKDSSQLLSTYIEANELEAYFKNELSKLQKTNKTNVVIDRAKFDSVNQNELAKDDILIVFSDWHIGKLIDFERNKFNMSIFRQRLGEIITQIKLIDKNNVRTLTLLFLGDLMESPIRNIRKGLVIENGVDQIQECSRFVLECIEQCVNHFQLQATALFVSGNHDRATQDINEDYDRIPYKTMVDIVRFNCEYRNIPVTITHSPRRTCYHSVNDHVSLIYFHGDACSKIPNLVMSDTTAKHKLLVQGHLHHKSFVDTGLNYTHVVQPSLCGASEHEFDELGYVGSPGQCLLRCRGSRINVEWLDVSH